jgi:glycosyltransferase involved in cell wall biosynthesis
LLNIYNPFIIPVFKQTLKKIDPDIVHIHNFVGNISFSIFNVLQELKIPLIHTAHDYNLICPRSTLLCYSSLSCNIPKTVCKTLRKLQKLLLGKKDVLFIAPSNFLAARLRESGLGPTIVIPNPVEKEVNIGEKDYSNFHILYIGRLKWLKGVHVLIKAFRDLKCKNVKLHIVGRGPEEEKLKKLAGLDMRIIFHGFVSEIKKQELLQKANITVIPSLWPEPFPMTALESLQRGIPVIASKIGGLPEIVKDEYNGKLFEPGNFEELKRIINELINDGETIRKMGKNAVESITRYKLDEHLAKLEKVYNKLVS